jgi:hypothetical protein
LAKDGVSIKSGMLDGLKNRSPEACDASCKPKGGSVNSEATRSETAPNVEAQGPRVA